MKKLKFRFILPLLLSLVLALGSCMTVFAAPSSDWSFPEGYEDLGHNVVFVFGDWYYYITSEAPILVGSYNDVFSFYSSSGSSLVFYSDLTPKWSVASSVNNFPKDRFSVLYCDHDICFRNSGEVFFRSPLARLAVPLKAEVLKQTKTILPVGVGCLALLIGSVVLLPRLRRSLLRL